MKRIVYMNGGALVVCTPVINTNPEPENITEDEAVERAMLKLPATATDIRVLAASAIPATREHRSLWQYNDDKTAVVVEAVAMHAATAARLLIRIDTDTDAIYGAVLGNRAQEYVLAEKDAAAYKADGYTGSVPASVQGWATAKGWTGPQSTDDILATAASWRLAQGALRSNRLLRKEQARVAATSEALDAIAAQWAGFVAAIRGQLGLL